MYFPYFALLLGSHRTRVSVIKLVCVCVCVFSFGNQLSLTSKSPDSQWHVFQGAADRGLNLTAASERNHHNPQFRLSLRLTHHSGATMKYRIIIRRCLASVEVLRRTRCHIHSIQFEWRGRNMVNAGDIMLPNTCGPYMRTQTM